MARFAQKIYSRLRAIEEVQVKATQAHISEKKRRKETEAELQHVLADVGLAKVAYEKTAAGLKKWQDRQPYINHYLGVVIEMAK